MEVEQMITRAYRRVITVNAWDIRKDDIVLNAASDELKVTKAELDRHDCTIYIHAESFDGEDSSPIEGFFDPTDHFKMVLR